MPTYPGFHPDFEIAGYPGQIRTAIRRIALHFYVTRPFHPTMIGNSKYWAVLVRPSDEFSVYINTDREVLIVFSEHTTFEIRTLDAYDAFYEHLDYSRVDKSLRFLVSADDRIESIIRHYLDQNPEYPIIIPTTFNSFDNSANTLLDAVRRNYLLRDLFGYQNPLREENFFFGRQHIVTSVLDMARSGQNSSLFGLRKSGKTSAIYAVQRKSRALSCNVTVVDCQNPAVHARTYDGLLTHILSEIRRSSGLKRVVIDLGSTLSSVSENFVAQMNNILSAVKNTVLLIFDEIENISPQTASSDHWKTGNDTLYFWQILRSYIQSESRGRFSICIVGTSPYILEATRINNIANPVYLYAKKQFLPSLSFEETKEMVQRLGYFMGLEFSSEIVAELQREFGGHPFFTRQVCSKVHQLASSRRPIKVSSNIVHQAKTAFYGELENYLKDILDQLKEFYPAEFGVLKSVIEGNTAELTEYGLEAPDLIDHLIGYGLVERSGEHFDIRLSAIKVVLQRLIASEHGEDRWAEISRRRNAVETSIRLALFHWVKTIDRNVWSDVIDQNLTTGRRQALTTTEPRVLFSKSETPLYLSDLMMLIKDERVLPYIQTEGLWCYLP
ncbi:hypothetical protein [Mesorhizobium sp. M0053]|uniref:hypothetical protein n=1 Tax=Mesorhizobium sp. M0053 TaxID=2956864 RepID=UPI00333C5FCE